MLKPIFANQLSIEEFKVTKIYWIKALQNEYFSLEIDFPKYNKTPTLLVKLMNLKFTDNILMFDRRLKNYLLPYDTKFCSFLPNKSPFTKFLIRNVIWYTIT